MAAWPKISRGGGYIRKIFGQGGVYQKYPPTPLFPLPGYKPFTSEIITHKIYMWYAYKTDITDCSGFWADSWYFYVRFSSLVESLRLRLWAHETIICLKRTLNYYKLISTSFGWVTLSILLAVNTSDFGSNITSLFHYLQVIKWSQCSVDSNIYSNAFIFYFPII